MMLKKIASGTGMAVFGSRSEPLITVVTELPPLDIVMEAEYLCTTGQIVLCFPSIVHSALLLQQQKKQTASG